MAIDLGPHAGELNKIILPFAWGWAREHPFYPDRYEIDCAVKPDTTHCESPPAGALKDYAPSMRSHLLERAEALLAALADAGWRPASRMSWDFRCSPGLIVDAVSGNLGGSDGMLPVDLHVKITVSHPHKPGSPPRTVKQDLEIRK